MNTKPKKVLLLGSGALKIGEAGEFDYSGSQALKALREEGVSSVLINPNIATFQTSAGMADKIYFLPVTPHFVQEVIKKEKPDGILLGFGGQTALNCGLALAQGGIFKKYNIEVLGTPIEAIRDTEDRELFKKKLSSLGLFTPRSIAVTRIKDIVKAAEKIKFPIILRGAFSLGGQGSAVVFNEKELREATIKALASTPQILVEEYLVGWKEIEYEVVRDRFDNCITVCNMENLDPMGIHTGESIVVAPSQTLTNHEYFHLRDVSIRTIRGLKIVGECNIQFALNPHTSEYRIIEVNARLSRSSALASKATGYPLASIAAKLALGHRLNDLRNSVTRTTSAFFEPALDYIVVKMPRWDLRKLKFAATTIGSEMKSVGEVMAIGRTFPEAIQKATRMINQGYQGLIDTSLLEEPLSVLREKLETVTPERIFILTAALAKGLTLTQAHTITHIDYWFLSQLGDVAKRYIQIKKEKLSKAVLMDAKMYGFSDAQIGGLFATSEDTIRDKRKKWGIVPKVKQIDTLAGEFPAKTNYLYCTYHGQEDDVNFQRAKKQRIAVLGGGPYHIGSSVEFDWCAVHSILTLAKEGYSTVMINCNPETVSTDYDISDTLYFEELTSERVLDIWEKEKLEGMILSMGGQIPNTLAHALNERGIIILGTHPKDIDRAEDRHKFSNLLDTLAIEQPPWVELKKKEEVLAFVDKVDYPVLIRPSYVLSGTAMVVAYTPEDIKEFFARRDVPWGYPIVVSKFFEGAAEFDFDAVASKGKILVSALCEHIEEAGVHSGDATLMLPPQRVYLTTARIIETIAAKIAHALHISGPFNIQFLAKEGRVYVIECNLRASRSFPFCSKVTNTNFIEIATRAILRKKITLAHKGLLSGNNNGYIGIKAPQFSFGRLRGADPILRVEMASTGEVGTLGETIEDAFLKAFLAVGNILPKKSILLTIGGNAQKEDFLEYAKTLHSMGYQLYATSGTAQFLSAYQLPVTELKKGYEGGTPGVLDYLARKKVDFVIIVSDKPDISKKRMEFRKEMTDGYRMRRIAADLNIPIITNLQLAKLFVRALATIKEEKNLSIKAWEQI